MSSLKSIVGVCLATTVGSMTAHARFEDERAQLRTLWANAKASLPGDVAGEEATVRQMVGVCDQLVGPAGRRLRISGRADAADREDAARVFALCALAASRAAEEPRATRWAQRVQVLAPNLAEVAAGDEPIHDLERQRTRQQAVLTRPVTVEVKPGASALELASVEPLGAGATGDRYVTSAAQRLEGLSRDGGHGKVVVRLVPGEYTVQGEDGDTVRFEVPSDTAQHPHIVAQPDGRITVTRAAPPPAMQVSKRTAFDGPDHPYEVPRRVFLYTGVAASVIGLGFASADIGCGQSMTTSTGRDAADARDCGEIARTGWISAFAVAAVAYGLSGGFWYAQADEAWQQHQQELAP